ncbi:MAG: acyl-ACP desaturase [Myxococcales bacterium]|nr:acyl-ACP desaturase [Myxococcales bacterium]
MADLSIDELVERSGAVRLDDLDWAEAAKVGVTDAEARVLRYMADTETHTIIYMRDLLAGYSARDPEITAFLSVWVYEELWHGRAIDKLLAATGRPVNRERSAEVVASANVQELLEAILSFAAAWMTPRFIAVHMAWGALNELAAAASYNALARQTENPVLRVLCRRISQQERKHFAFYYQQARKRMVESRLARRLTHLALHRFWGPVGDGVAGRGNLEFVVRTLFSDPTSWSDLERAEERIRQLPGLEDFHELTGQLGALLPVVPSAA